MALEGAKTAIESICGKIQSLMESMRPPANIIPGVIMICSLVKRPGLSTIVSVGKIITDLSKKGFITGKNADGSANMTNLLVESIVSEIYRAIKMDMNMQVAFKPGSMMFTGTGANSGGPVVVNGVNTTFGQGVGVAQ